jgi:hypothetical protein
MSSDPNDLSLIIPTPEQFRAFTEYAFEDLSVPSELFYSCCKDCAIEHMRDDIEEEHYVFMFATLTDLEHASKTGELFFHYGQVHNDSVSATEEVGKILVDQLKAQGFRVSWSGKREDRFHISVDRHAYGHLHDSMNKTIHQQRSVPMGADIVPCPYPGFVIALWEENGLWWYDVSDASGSLDRDHKMTREAALEEALACTEEHYLDVN